MLKKISLNSTISNKFVLLLVFLGSIYSQSQNRDYDEELRYQNQAINDLRKEINSLRLKIKKAESKENSAKNRISLKYLMLECISGKKCQKLMTNLITKSRK